MPSQPNSAQATERTAVLDKLHEISSILDTGLDRETLAILKELCEQGVNPQSLAQVIKFLRREQTGQGSAADGNLDSSAAPNNS